MSPFIGNGAIQQDLFRPMFNPNYQIMDKYVINQDFQTQNILKKEFMNNKDYILVSNPLDNDALVTYQQMLRIMPISLYTGAYDSNTEIKKIAGNAFTVFIESEIAQSWSIVRVANLVDKSASADVSLNSDQSINADLSLSATDTLEHKLSFQVYALQSAVKFSYSGALNASIMVNEKNHETTIALSKNLNNSSTLSIQNFENTTESRQIISLAMSF